MQLLGVSDPVGFCENFNEPNQPISEPGRIRAFSGRSLNGFGTPLAYQLTGEVLWSKSHETPR